MTSTSPRRLAAAAAFIILGSIPVRAAESQPAAPAKEPGDRWEVTTQMSMEGAPMALPAQTHKVCSAKVWKEAPGATDERQKCKTSDFKLEGAKATWKVACDGPPPMTGEGEITRSGSDDYAGTIKFMSSHGTMILKIKGHRLGDCEVAQ
ncbi:MAG TPA: DUF3617 family protein [Candidatus Polarisedimenticolia bacterium]|nr:DUF3617 family protein [Candidatus Polarisedimenticolia bacterium]